MTIDVDLWVRGSLRASTQSLAGFESPADWTSTDVHRLLEAMLRALEREKNPDGEPPPVTLRGFSWIVSPYDTGGVILHVETQMGTASAGPLAIGEASLTALVTAAMRGAEGASTRVH